MIGDNLIVSSGIGEVKSESNPHDTDADLIVALREINRDFLINAELADPSKVDFAKPKGVEFWSANYYGTPTSRMIVYLRSDVGCSYGQRTGGCLACRHWRIGTAGRKLDIENMYVRQMEAAIDGQRIPPIVNLYNEGNVLNGKEIPEEQLLEIVSLVSSTGAKRLVLESRPEYISDGLLQKVGKAAGEMEIEVGIGLESVSGTIRNDIFLKGMSLKSYEKSVASLKRNGMRALSYVIIKPPFLTEGESIEEAVSTGKYAFEVGTDAISLEPIGVEPSTITEFLFKRSLFEPAKLWSVVEVQKEIGELGEVRLGGTQFAPRPTTLPHNCDECTASVLRGMDVYNATYDSSILTKLDCACKETFENNVLKRRAPAKEDEIRDRLNNFIRTTNPRALGI